MEFTNEIRFNKKPKNNKLLKITYSGSLFKNNSNDVYIVYGFGENWEKTTEQKMQKETYGFTATIYIENYNTFNFCFKNNQNEWDNNNYFNYISPIDISYDNNEIDTLNDSDASKTVTNSIDNIVNNIDLNIENNSTETSSVTKDNNIVENLVQELIQEYNSNKTLYDNNGNVVDDLVQELIQEYNSNKSLYDNNSNVVDDLVQKLIQEYNSNKPLYDNNSNVVDDLVQELIQEYNSNKSLYDNNSNVVDDLVQELIQEYNANKQFYENDNTFEISNDYKEQSSKIDLFKNVSNIFDDVIKEIKTPTLETHVDVGIELNKAFDELFEDSYVQNVETKEDYIPSPDKFDLFSVSNKIENDIFDFENKEFNFNLSDENTENSKTTEIEVNSNKFSDSYYDDEAELDGMTSIQEIISDTVNELNNTTSSDVVSSDNAAFQKQSDEFDKAVNEYAEYFDNLIEEIVSFPTSSLSNTVSNKDVIQNETIDLTVVESQDLAIANNTQKSSDSDSVSNEYALFDYQSHSIFYMLKRRFKLLFNSLFSKLPKIFGKETDSNN